MSSPQTQPKNTQKMEEEPEKPPRAVHIETGRKALEEAIASYKPVSVQEFELTQRKAIALSQSDLVPENYRGNAANCMIAIELAERADVSPLMVMQNLAIIYGRPSWSAQYCIGAVNTSGRFHPLQFDISGEGDKRQSIAWAIHKETGERVEGPPVSVAMAKAEGWYNRLSKKGEPASKWPTMTDLMLTYRSATFFARIYVPDRLMGFPTVEESVDIGPPESPAKIQRESAMEALRSANGEAQTKPENYPPDTHEPEIDPETGEVVPSQEELDAARELFD